jgi:hypothetical protein
MEFRHPDSRHQGPASGSHHRALATGLSPRVPSPGSRHWRPSPGSYRQVLTTGSRHHAPHRYSPPAPGWVLAPGSRHRGSHRRVPGRRSPPRALARGSRDGSRHPVPGTGLCRGVLATRSRHGFSPWIPPASSRNSVPGTGFSLPGSAVESPTGACRLCVSRVVRPSVEWISAQPTASPLVCHRRRH